MSEDDPRIGRVLDGKWTLERLLGTGGMASVYSARHRNGARAAVKVLHPELAVHQELRERFLREGYAANRVEHPGAVAVLDDDVVKAGPDAGAAYIVMELLDGELLEDRAARPLSEHELLLIADSVLDVLDAAHSRGVIHRDLKPDNLFLLRTGDDTIKVKVLDFGLARLTEGRIVTRAGVALGTPTFMSPEQAAGKADEIDGRSDLFSLGAVLFRLRTGKRIHEAANVIELVGKMAREPAPPIRSVDASVSPEFAAIVDRAIQFAREDRYPDAKAMSADVRRALEALAPPPPPPVSPREVERRGEFPWVFILLLALGGGFVWYKFRPSTRIEVPQPVASAAVDTGALDTTSDTTIDVPDTTVEDAALAALAADADDDAEEEEEELDDADVDAEVDAELDAQMDADALVDTHAQTAASALKTLVKPATPKKPTKPAWTPPKKKKKKK